MLSELKAYIKIIILFGIVEYLRRGWERNPYRTDKNAR